VIPESSAPFVFKLVKKESFSPILSSSLFFFDRFFEYGRYIE